MLRFRCDHVANTRSVTASRNRASPPLAGSPTKQRLTALHSRSPPQRTYGLLQTRPHGSLAAQPAALKPPGQFRAAPLPHRCRVPPVRAPGQDFHLRSQHPYPAHQEPPLRGSLRSARSGSRDSYPSRLPQNRACAVRTRLLGTVGYDPRRRPVCDLDLSPSSQLWLNAGNDIPSIVTDGAVSALTIAFGISAVAIGRWSCTVV